MTIPNYNHAHLLPRALDSLLAQERRPDEILVQDDASTDHSLEVLRGYGERHPDLIFVEANPRNLGVNYNARKLRERARGKYLFPLGADDFVLPSFFSQALALLEQHPEAGGCICDMGVVDPQGQTIPRVGFGLPKGYVSPREIIRRVSKIDFPLVGSSSILRRDYLNQEGVVMDEIHWHQDWLYTSVIAFRYGLCYLPGRHAFVELQEGSYHRGMSNVSIDKQCVRQLLEAFLTGPLQDARQALKDSGYLRMIGFNGAEVLFFEPRYWRFHSWACDRKLIPRYLIWRLLTSLPESLRVSVKRALGLRGQIRRH